MASVNKVLLIGNLGRDPELKFMASGNAVCNFSVATTETWKDKAGEKQEKTEWHRIAVFGKTAELCGEYLSKGKTVYVEGRLQTREYEKDGVKRYATEIVGDRVQFLSPRSEGSGSAGRSESRGDGKRDAAPAKQGDFDEDIPF